MKEKIEKEIINAKKELKEAEDAPTGKCEISVGSSQYCYNLTQKSCYKVANNVGGVATWTENEKC